jgi:hypothetical protein
MNFSSIPTLLSPYLLSSVTFHSCRDRILLIGGRNNSQAVSLLDIKVLDEV